MFRNLLIIVAIFGIGWGASFGAGMAIGKRSAPAPNATTTTQAAGVTGQNQFGGAGGTGGAGGNFAGGQFRGAAGTVDHVDGQTLVLTGANNQQTRVSLTGQTQITKQVDGTSSDLTAGSAVTVQAQGQPGTDGTITAASVTVLPPGAAGRLAQSGPGAAGGQQGQNAAGGGTQGQNGQGGQRQGGAQRTGQGGPAGG